MTYSSNGYDGELLMVSIAVIMSMVRYVRVFQIICANFRIYKVSIELTLGNIQTLYRYRLSRHGATPIDGLFYIYFMVPIA